MEEGDQENLRFLYPLSSRGGWGVQERTCITLKQNTICIILISKFLEANKKLSTIRKQP